jgi:long-chain acyl-CoA synthetase
MNLAQLLVRTARAWPERPALFHGTDLICDYRGLADRVSRIGGFLVRELELVRGDRVALFMGNAPEYLELLFGALHAGLVVVPINARLHAREAQFILQDSGAAALFASEEHCSGLVPLLPSLPALRCIVQPGSEPYRRMYRQAPLPVADCRGEDLAWLFYTSGTTGRPKGVMITHRNLLAMMGCHFMDVAATHADDCAIYAAPMSHGAGLGSFAHVVAGARHVVARSAGFEPDEIVDLAARHRNAFMFAAPTMVKRLAGYVEDTGTDCSGFKTILYGGGPMDVEDIQYALRVMGDRFVQVYGQGETPMTICVLSAAHLADRGHPRYAERLASVGVAQAVVDVRVVDALGRQLPTGQAGEVVVRGDTVMKGYWRNPEATTQTLRDGWLFTGDIGCFDSDGFLTLKDRATDLIISGGSDIYAREIEEVLLLHPAVDEASVVGRRHAEWGEEVVAFVAARSGCTVDPEELDALCLQHIARFKRPRHYRMVPALPKSHYGKVLKTLLREMLDRDPNPSDSDRVRAP